MYWGTVVFYWYQNCGNNRKNWILLNCIVISCKQKQTYTCVHITYEQNTSKIIVFIKTVHVLLEFLLKVNLRSSFFKNWWKLNITSSPSFSAWFWEKTGLKNSLTLRLSTLSVFNRKVHPCPGYFWNISSRLWSFRPEMVYMQCFKQKCLNCKKCQKSEKMLHLNWPLLYFVLTNLFIR